MFLSETFGCPATKNARNSHDESIVDSLRCLLLYLLGNALQHTTTSTMFHQVFGILSIVGIEHDPQSLRLHVVLGCRFVQHKFLSES